MAGFQQVKVNRDLVFAGAAATQPNIKGPMMTELKMFDETFIGDASEHDWVSTTGANGLTLTHTSVDGGAELLTMGGATDDCGEFYHLAQWSPYHACGMQAKLKISAITNVSVCVGFVDQYENLNDHTAIEMASGALTAATNTEDFCGMVFDTDASSSYWYYGASEGGVEGTPVVCPGTLAPVADTYFKVRVQTDRSGNVWFYYASGDTQNDLVSVGYLPGAVASTVANLLTPYVGFIARTGVALTSTVSRITTWQEN